MTKAHQYFPIGEEFMYTPKSDTSATLRLVPVSVSFAMCSSCAIMKYCESKSNYVHDGVKFIPECYSTRRPDRESVIFKEM